MATESRRKGIKLVIALCIIVALAVTGVLIWTSRRATVRFYSEVESNIENISVSIGGTIDQPKDPVAKDPGYSFGGWYSDPNYLTEFDFDLPIQKDTTVYVKWVRRSFTVTVLRATTGGNFYEVLWTGSAKYKETIQLPGTSTFMNYSWMGADDSRQYPFRRANQNFLGFATRDNGIGDYGYTYSPDSSFTIPNTSVQLYAVFRGDERSFVFKPNDGDGTEKTEKGYFNENFTVPTSEGLSKKYYTFAYWCVDADGIPRDSEGNILGDEVDSDGNITTSAEDRTECANIYWPGQTVKIDGTQPTVLYAIWKRNKVNIMIDARGGSHSLGLYGDNLVDAGLEGGYDLSTITKPTRDGYRLISYNTQENGLGTSYSLDAVLQVEEDDIALYAIWQRHLTVGYTLNTNRASDDDLYKAGGYDDFVGIEGESFTVQDIPVTIDIPNFRFLGWSLNSEATQAEYHSGDTFVLRESDFENGVDKIYLYGIWQGDARILRLKNTSDNQVQEISSYFGRMERLSSIPVHVDTNYEFIGWGTVEEYNYKNPDSYTGRIYEVGSQFEMGTNTEIGQSRDILYSLWRPFSYDITYYTQGGMLTAIAPEEQASGFYIKDYVYKETITLYSQVEREGYRFMGWSYSSNSQECAFPTEGENGFTLVMPGNSMQLYAVWQKEYTITFYNNATDAAGLVTAITGKILGETFTIPTEEVSNTGIIRDNYKIIGWSSKSDGGTVYEFGAEIVLESSDMISYYAIWQGDARYVEVYNGVTKVATIEGHYGEDIPLAFEEEIEGADPGQEIGGFYAMIKTSPTTEATRYDFAYGANIKTTTLYFKDENGAAVNTLKVYIEWTNKYFSVVYELNGGIYNNDDNDDMSAYRIYKQYTTEVTLESGIPTKTRYEFKGWTETPDDDNPVLYAAGGKFVIPSHDVTLYAYWARIYTISFNSNGGTLAEGADESDLKAGSYSRGTNFIIPNNVYERTNYTFKCWSTRASGATSAGGEDYNVGDTLTITSDITLYAVWQGQEVNVTLISVDPGNAAYETRTVQITPTPRYGDTISLGTYSSAIPAPDQGLTLKGWVIGRQPTDLDIDVEYTNDYTIDSVGNIEIYAVWSAKKFYFTVGLAGGVCNNSYSDQAESYAFRQNIDMSYYSNRIKKEGYRLIGYANSATATVADYAVDSIITMPNISKKVFCVWIELAIITFDKNCESDTLENYVFEGVPNDAIDGEINLTNVNKMFTRDNYTLLGWSTSSTATTPDAGFSIDNDTYRIISTQDIHLFAVWEGRSIQVFFNSNGGQNATEQESKKYGDVIDLTLDKYKRTHSDVGFSFGGWSRVAGYDNANATVGSTFTVATDKLTDASITLYAIWNKRYFTLTLSYGDSTLGSKATPDGYDSRQVQYTSTIDLTQYVTQAKKRLGYDFLGWAENQYETNASKIYGAPDADGNPTNVTFTMPNSAVTLYALWDPIYVDVIYTSNTPAGANAEWTIPGVSGGQSYTKQELYQLSFKLPSNKIASGVSVVVPTYRFVGWILDGDSTQTIRKEGQWLQVNTRSPMTLIAQWEENKITVAINGNGGIFVAANSGTLQVAVKENNYYTLPTSTELVRGGYRLTGYQINGTKYDIATYPSIQITSSLIAEADIDANTIRITAIWIQQYTVIFSANNAFGDGTTGSIDNVVVDNGTVITLPNCSAVEGYYRPHYRFLHWNTEPDDSGTSYNAGDSQTVYSSYTLYAIWEGDNRTLTLYFNTNQNGHLLGDSVAREKTYTGLKYGQQLDFSNAAYSGEADAEGYVLDGWSTTPYDSTNPSAFVVQYAFGSMFTITGEDDDPVVRLYAVWGHRSYRVTYDVNGGVFNDGSLVKDGAVIEYESEFTINGTLTAYNPSATKQFYTLVGWSIDRNFSYKNKANRPTSLEEPNSSYNYVFRNSSGSEVSGFKMPHKDVVLYAIWEPVDITISIIYDKDSIETVNQTMSVKYGDTIELPNFGSDQNIKADHNFDKWQHLDTDKSTVIASYLAGGRVKITESTMSNNEATANTKTIIFAGTWIPQTVYFEIDGNEGSFGERSTYIIQSSVGREITLPKIKETTENYKLLRENFALKLFTTNRNGTGTTYAPGSKVQIPSLSDSRVHEETIIIDDERITTYVFRVYAQWVEAEAYIYLSDNSSENPFYETLAAAIDDASNNARIVIIKDCYITSKITISKAITIEAQDSDKTIYRYIGTADNNYADAFKGICFEILTTGQLSLGTDNIDYDGPAVYFDGQNSKLKTVTNSFIVVRGSALLYNGVYFKDTYASIGGAINVDNTNATLNLKYVAFENNSASEKGGAIAVVSANNISIINCTFRGNVSESLAGAIYNSGATVDIQSTYFDSNEADYGGAVYNDTTGTISDRGNTYTLNYAQSSGGAIYNKGFYTLTGGDNASAIFTLNSAKTSGGVIYNDESASGDNLTIINCVFGQDDDEDYDIAANTSYSGAVILNAGRTTITSSQFYYNNTNSNGEGGAIQSKGSKASLVVKGCTFKGNKSDAGSGGAIVISSGVAAIGEDGSTSSNNTFIANSVTTGKGHAVALVNGTLNIYTSTFRDHYFNENSNYGGVISQSGGVLNICGATISGNTLVNVDDYSTGSYGGALLVSNGTCNIRNISISNNRAKYGGGIAIINSGTVVITNCEVYGNRAAFGGGIYLRDSNSTITMNGGLVGAIDPDQANNAVGDGVESGLGGGIFNKGSLNINGASIRGNSTSGNGGGIYSNGAIVLVSGRISGNIASRSGGAIYADATGGGTNGTVKFNCGTTVSMNITDNLCADGAYPLCTYDENSIGYANGIYTETKVIISGYMTIGYNSDMSILNDIFLAVRDTDANPTSKIVVFDSNESYTLSSETRICISSIVALMGDKLVLFPSTTDARREMGKFSFAGDDAGFRLDGRYLKLGNYAATIIRGGNENFYATLTEAYLEAQDGETIYVYKNIVMSNDLAIYDETNDFETRQIEALGSDIVSGVGIRETFYISKNVTFVSGGDYSISRGDLTGDMFTVVGEGQLNLGVANPGNSNLLTIRGGTDILTGSIIKVEFSDAFVSGAHSDDYQFTLNNGVKITQNKAETGGAINSNGKIAIRGGEITRNTAESETGGLGGAIYSEGTTSYVYITDNANINNNTAHSGGGIYINSDSSDSNSLVMDSATAVIKENTSSYAGGGIYIFDGQFNLIAGEISSNKSNERASGNPGGGGVYLGSGSSMVTNYKTAYNDANAQYIQIKNNKTGSYGGGVLVNNATFTFDIGYITGNNATFGGAVAVNNTTTEETNAEFISSNSSRFYNYITGNTANNGGAIAVIKGTAKLSYIKLSENTATNGGGIYVAGTLETGAETYIGNSNNNKGNTASTNGGGIYISATGELVQNANTLYVTANEATGGEGGGIYNLGTIDFTATTYIFNNRAFTGGGIANLDSGTLNIRANGNIYRNTATGDTYGGGGVYNVGVVNVLSNYTFGGSGSVTDGNSAVRGGGIYTQGTFNIGKADEKLNLWVYINYNSVTLFGGGLFVGGGSFYDYSIGVTQINNNTQSLNAGGGAGICISDGSFTSKVNNYMDLNGNAVAGNNNCWLQIDKNSAAGAGGALLVSGSAGSVSNGGVILNGARVTNNTAVRGGAVSAQSGILKFGDQNGGQTTRSPFQGNSAPLGGDLYLQTQVYINTDITPYYTGTGSWAGGIYLANARSYLVFSKKTETTSIAPAVNDYYLPISVNEFTDGRRIAKFSSYMKEVTLPGADGGSSKVEYQTSFAEDYFKKFSCETGSNYGISYDDNGYVILAEPVAKNLTQNTYHSTLMEAADKAKSGDYIHIIKSHTVTEQVLIVDKSINFVISSSIILTRSPKLTADMFRGFTTNNNTAYTINFNPTYTGTDGTKYGTDVVLTLDGNKSNPSLLAGATPGKATSRGSLIGVHGGLYAVDDSGKFVESKYNVAGFMFGMGQAGTYSGKNYRLYGSEVDSATRGNFALYPGNINLNVRYVDFVNNAAGTAGGAITYRGYTPNSSSSARTLTISNCNFTNNETFFAYGGTIYNSGTGGGAIFAMGGKLNITDSTFDGNSSYTGGGAITSLLQQGYGTNSKSTSVSLSYTPIYIASTIFSNNTAKANGGALEIIQHDDGYSSFTISDTVNFYGNSAGGSGGAIYRKAGYYNLNDIINIGAVWGNSVDIVNKTEYEEQTSINGTTVTPAIKVAKTKTTYVPTSANYSSKFTLSGSVVFEGNSSTNGSGGAVYDYNSLTITAESVRFDGNTSKQNGGAICSEYFAYIKGVTCINNKSKQNGGAIYISQTPTVFAKATLTNNEATYDGGGVYFYSLAKLGIEGSSYGSSYNNTISNNIAGRDGGGVYLRALGSQIYGGSFNDNSAGNYGGGICAPASNGNNLSLYIYGAEDISGNKASLRGGGIYSYGTIILIGTDTGGTNISNNEVYSAGNMSGGAGIWSYWEVRLSGTINFLNNKITADTAANNGGGGAIFAYLDEIWISDCYYSSSQSLSWTNPSTIRFRQDGIMPQITGNRYSYGTMTMGNTTIPYSYFYSSGTSSPYYYVAYCANITISGNSAGASYGDGIYYWGSSIYMSGNIQMEDDIFMHNDTASKVYVDNYIMTNQNPFSVTYVKSPSIGATMVIVVPGVNFTRNKASMFNVTNNNYYVELKSGQSYDASDDNSNYYNNTQRELVFRTGSVNVVVKRSYEDEELRGSKNAPQADMRLSYGDSLSLLYKDVKPAREGYNFDGFNILDNSGNVLKSYRIGSVIDSITYGSNWTKDSNGIYKTTTKIYSTSYSSIPTANVLSISLANKGTISFKYRNYGTYNSSSYGRLYYWYKNSNGTINGMYSPNYYYSSTGWTTWSGTYNAGTTLYFYQYCSYSSYTSYNNYIEIKDINDKDVKTMGDDWEDNGGVFKTSVKIHTTGSSVPESSQYRITAAGSGTISFKYRCVSTDGHASSSYGELHWVMYNASGSYYTYSWCGRSYSTTSWYSYNISISAGYTIGLYFYASSTTSTTNYVEIKDITTPSDSAVKSFPLLPSEDTLKSMFGGTVPTNINMTCIWEAQSYTLWVHKYILDTGSVYGSLSTKEGEYAKEYSTNNSYCYTINSNEKFEKIINDLETSNSKVDSTVKKDYLLGYSKVGYMLSYDRKYYTKDDRYPYSFGYDITGSASSGKSSTDLYIVYKTAEYTLKFNADDNSELLTDNTTLKVKYGKFISLLSANLIYRKGYTLAGWLGNDGNTYYAPGGKELVKRTYEIVSGSTSYPWAQNGDTWQSTNQGINSTNSSMFVKILEGGYFSFDYKSYGESSCDYLIVYRNGSQVFSRQSQASSNFYNYSMAVSAGDTIEFRYRKDGSVHTYDDTAYIKNLSGSAKQTSYTFTSDMSFTPIWEAVPFDVRVYYNYPDGGTSFKLYSITAGSNLLEALNASPIPNPVGYTLKGYSYSADKSAELIQNYDTMPGEDIILYAQWQAVTVTIRYYDSDWTLIHEQQALFGTEIELWEYDGISIWQNYGDKMLYIPGGSYLISNMGEYYLQFTPQGM